MILLPEMAQKPDEIGERRPRWGQGTQWGRTTTISARWDERGGTFPRRQSVCRALFEVWLCELQCLSDAQYGGNFDKDSEVTPNVTPKLPPPQCQRTQQYAIGQRNRINTCFISLYGMFWDAMECCDGGGGGNRIIT